MPNVLIKFVPYAIAMKTTSKNVRPPTSGVSAAVGAKREVCVVETKDCLRASWPFDLTAAVSPDVGRMRWRVRCVEEVG